jgi:hypothetical protein
MRYDRNVLSDVWGGRPAPSLTQRTAARRFAAAFDDLADLDHRLVIAAR